MEMSLEELQTTKLIKRMKDCDKYVVSFQKAINNFLNIHIIFSYSIT